MWLFMEWGYAERDLVEVSGESTSDPDCGYRIVSGGVWGHVDRNIDYRPLDGRRGAVRDNER